MEDVEIEFGLDSPEPIKGRAKAIQAFGLFLCFAAMGFAFYVDWKAALIVTVAFLALERVLEHMKNWVDWLNV